MKRLSTWILASVALALAVPALAERQPGGKTRVVNREASTPARSARVEPKAGAEAYSAQANIVTRVQGTALFRTAIDITNNTDVDGVDRFGPVLLHRFVGVRRVHPSDGHHAPAFDNFHTDDIVEYLGTPRRHPARRAGVVVRNAPRHLQERPLEPSGGRARSRRARTAPQTANRARARSRSRIPARSSSNRRTPRSSPRSETPARSRRRPRPARSAPTSASRTRT